MLELIVQAWIVQKVGYTMHWINHYPVDSVVCFRNAYSMDNMTICLLDSIIHLLNSPFAMTPFSPFSISITL